MHPLDQFHSQHYLDHNVARLAHVERLINDISIDPRNQTVLDLGAGVGDHSVFWIEKGAKVTTIEARIENVVELNRLLPGVPSLLADLEFADRINIGVFDIVYAYGLLYHLSDPSSTLDLMARACGKVLFLETCVSYGDTSSLNPFPEAAESPSQALSGTGCRPTRSWVFSELQKRFKYVYQPIYQPSHREFPTNWMAPEPNSGPLWRTTFVSSHTPITSNVLRSFILDEQIGV